MSLTAAIHESATRFASLPSARDAAAADAPARRGTIECTLALRHAGARTVRLRYECVGAPGLPVALVAGGISAGRHAVASDAFPERGWWQDQLGAGRALDPQRRRLLAIDWLGADGALDAPIDPADQADAIAAVLDALGIATLDAFVGCSYGAMVGLQFASRHPSRVARLVAVSGAHRAHPHASASRALQRRALALGALQCDTHGGLALARQIAILGYRTPEEFDARFGAARVVDGRVRTGAEDYLDHCANAYAARTPATGFLRLSESIDLQSVEPESIPVPVTVVAVAEDRLVPIEDAYALVERLARGSAPRRPQLRVLRSIYGHDAFLKEPAALDAILREALA
ncbi:MAG TPA: homoserine O-succinyltransferase [Luteimonas sp.]|jgi:homoserine O-acetyltransferase|nr:homoserine O-succinyltransferase [Luteimonas sp.]